MEQVFAQERLLRGTLSAARHMRVQRPGFDVAPVLIDLLEGASDTQDVLPIAAQAIELSLPDVVQAARNRLVTMGAAAGVLEMLDSQTAEGLFLMDNIPGRRGTPIAPVENRIAYVSYSSLPYHSTGYANRTHFLAQGLRAQGLDLQVISRPGYPWDEPASALETPAPEGGCVEMQDGVPYHRLKAPGYFSWDNHTAYVRHSTEALEACFRDLRPALVIAASNHACAMPACLAARRIGVPFVHEVRGFWEDSRAAREPGFMGSRQYFLERHWDGEVARRADRVVTLGTAMKRELVTRGVPAGQITIVPNGATEDTPRAPETRNAVPVIGYVGSFAAYEGLELLIEACAALKQDGIAFRLLLVGDGKGGGAGRGARRALLDLLAERGLSDRTEAPGRVPPEVARAYVQSLDIAVFPRLRSRVTERVTPLKPIEAMMAGKAIVASDVGGFDDMLGAGQTALRFAAGSVDGLYNALRKLLQDKGLRRALGARAQARAQADFLWPTICAGYAASLGQIAGQIAGQTAGRTAHETA
jgi:glycosyltransferase involved in cell wall biosynthesis